ncbi:hypothetical protein [Wenjunlia tyrosinilytica]|uniref:Uncharacterized protein n=1 Tax=Wenjunlia tyrosinilytica TaxID=1544741 RepID=A0A917ZX70_9ACTN|nr:hypothetical protein [Wenjunlia tyrosinilytica]GGO96780.1 hypothetical protein GCM10012280_57070 [Wenjunlia tyrosinilytica]
MSSITKAVDSLNLPVEGAIFTSARPTMGPAIGRGIVRASSALANVTQAAAGAAGIAANVCAVQANQAVAAQANQAVAANQAAANGG